MQLETMSFLMFFFFKGINLYYKDTLLVNRLFCFPSKYLQFTFKRHLTIKNEMIPMSDPPYFDLIFYFTVFSNYPL